MTFVRALITRGAVASALALTVGIGSSAGISAVHPGRAEANGAFLPGRCFAQVNVQHQVFGPNSFFLTPGTSDPASSFRENASDTVVTYPLYQGTSRGRTVYYVITGSSDLSTAQTLGVNYAPKLANAIGTAAVMNSSSATPTSLDFPASVSFHAGRVLIGNPTTGFPPILAIPGAMGETGYSPLVRLAGTNIVVNAPQIMNGTGRGVKVLGTDSTITRFGAVGEVQYAETDGCYDNESVHYASFDSSDQTAAAIEGATYAPDLGSAPSAGCADRAGTNIGVPVGCAREGLIAFTNGQHGATNPERQGLGAAILDHGLSPLNILQEIPEPSAQFDYSPLWDIHLETWTQAAVQAGLNTRQTDFSTAMQQATVHGLATGYPAGTPWRASGFIVNCPVVSLDVSH